MSTESDEDRSDRYKASMSLPEEHDVGGHSRSSSASLSSPPHSEPGSPSVQVANESLSSITVNNNPPTLSLPGPQDAAMNAIPGVPEKPPRKKPGRKPKPIDPNDPNPPKPRKPRPKRDPNAPIIRRGPRKSKTGVESSNPVLLGLSGAAGFARHDVPGFSNIHAAAPQVVAPGNGNYEPIQTQPHQQPIQSFFDAAPPPPPPQSHHHQIPQLLRSSGQNYDPIRSNSNYDPVRDHPSQGSPNHPPPSMNRASASPSISSLVDPPNQALISPSIAAQSFFNQQQQQLRFQRDESHPSGPPSPTVNRLASSAAIEPSPIPQPAPIVRPVPSNNMNISKKLNNGSTATSSAAASPKPAPKLKEKEIYITPPPLPGSGLMQLGGIAGGPNDGTEFRAPTVVLNIPMNGETNKYVNFTRMAEERYGWDALHPRLAAQRDRLARVAAAGAAIERNNHSNRESGDDMSLDSDGEGSNVEMGGMSDGRTGTDGGAKKIPRKRKMKEDEYDKDDGFVDDTELLWEEQAAATNDGFFVYSGPLVPEGEKPTLDLRADGAPKRGRGRGRGGATAGRGTGRGLLSGQARNGLPLTGPGSRGGSTTRKPRITKADRARMEQEKKVREQMGTMTIPGNYVQGGNSMTLAGAAVMGNTPMVFN